MGESLRFRRPGVLAAALLACVAAGCTGSDLGAEVSGVVALDGQPLSSGSVVFMPSDGVSNNATASIDAGGGYFLRTNQTDGLAPGRYKVAVTMHERVDVKPGERSMVVPKLLTPEKYADPATSGLEFDVEGGANTIDIVLSSK